MATPFLAEIRMMGCNFAPKGNALCNGQILPIPQNAALFSLLGTVYGGDGRTTFALPNLQGRTPMHPGQGPGLSNRTLGETGGTETITLLTTEIPSHSHAVACVDGPANQPAPAGTSWSAEISGSNFYGPPATLEPMAAGAISATGENQPHNNLQPSAVINFVIALAGTFPARN